ncbi:transferrin-binding protein-like solute binding protein [Rhodobacteraceae bacterium]|nr:transferrin-binding protein-like solute binding protein [Paracoccaceae bacterium]
MKLFSAIAIPSAMILSACGGGGSSDIDQAPSTRVLSKEVGENGTLGDVNAAKMLLTSQNGLISGTAIDWENGTTTKDAPTFAIKMGEAGLPYVVIDGKAYQFTEAHKDSNNFGFSNDNDPNFDETVEAYKDMWSYSGTLDEVLSEEFGGYAQAWSYYFGIDDSSNAQRGFAIVGTQTAMSDVANNATASYAGYARMQVADAEGYDGWRSEYQLQGNIGLDLDFEQSTISGTIKNIEGRDWADLDDQGEQIWTSLPGGLNLEKTNVNTVGQFKGTISADDTLKDVAGDFISTTSGSYSGALFGPDAEQVAGTLSLTSETQNAYGFFETSKSE